MIPRLRDLQEAREQFASLLSKEETKEFEWQRFFSQHPYVLSSALHIELLPQDIIPLGRPGRTEPDLIFYPRNEQQYYQSYGVIELKRPDQRILTFPRKNTVVLTRNAATAVAQGQEYLRKFEHGDILQTNKNTLFLGTSAYVFIIMGLTKELEQAVASEVVRGQLKSILPSNFRIIPYDFLLKRFEASIPPTIMAAVSIEPTKPKNHLCVLASGSRGNAIHIALDGTQLLIDAGISSREIQRRMKARMLFPKELNAIIVSHEHSDHIQGVGTLSRLFRIPVYLTPKTFRAAKSGLGDITDIRPFSPGIHFRIGNVSVFPFSTSHDAVDPVGFTLTNHETKIGIATDLGTVNSTVLEHLNGCSCMVLEANHDPEMLLKGPYPWPVKQRIQSRRGHLSNLQASQLIASLLSSTDKMKNIVLTHLSEPNNTPEIALRAIYSAIDNDNVSVTVARQDEPTSILPL